MSFSPKALNVAEPNPSGPVPEKIPPSLHPGRRRIAPLAACAGALLLAGWAVHVYLAADRQAPVALAPPPAQPAAPGTASAESLAVPLPAAAAAVNEAAPAVAQAAAFPRPAAAVVAPPAKGEDAIKVIRGGEDAVSPDLIRAYGALQEGRLDAARTLYQRILQAEPRNPDALLGLAAIAARDNRPQEAGGYYLRTLELEPQNAAAQAGLLTLLGATDPAASEARLKQLLASRPAAFLHFTLGNLYAGQERWAEAQQAYFQAHHLEPEQPDYAFNLAVGLEHLGQAGPALEFYRRARELAASRGAGFEPARLDARIARLEHDPG
jgi:tetratricopeptide (TPR) repeat protein